MANKYTNDNQAELDYIGSFQLEYTLYFVNDTESSQKEDGFL